MQFFVFSIPINTGESKIDFILCVVIFVAVAVLLKSVLHNFDAEYNGSNLITSCHCFPGLTLNIKHQLERTAVSQMYGYLQITRNSSLPMCPSIVNTPTD